MLYGIAYVADKYIMTNIDISLLLYKIKLNSVLLQVHQKKLTHKERRKSYNRDRFLQTPEKRAKQSLPPPR